MSQPNSWEIHSVGIDIGTTTSQLIFSRLKVVNRAAVSQVPSYEFSEREILYVSPAAPTPIDAEGNVREAPLREFIRAQYAAAGFGMSEIGSGAIIITGETSKARNARTTIMALAEELGDFIVATAGPHLESVIAGQGSGAAEMSRQANSRVLNIDIGGGTSNYAVFEAGRVVDTACLNVGGHLLELESGGRVKRLHAPARLVCEELFGAGFSPGAIDAQKTERLARRMAELVYEICIGRPSGLAQKLLMTPCLRAGHRYDAVCISGGVGACYYHPETAASPLAFGDIGPILADALRRNEAMRSLPLAEPKQTLRATVIGAGVYSLSLSGSTIWIDSGRLPIRNVPVVHPAADWRECTAGGPGALAAAWELTLRRMDLSPQTDSYALALPADMPVAYRGVEYCAGELARIATAPGDPRPARPLFVVARQDVGKVLGMLLQPLLPGREVAVIDEVSTHEGDYIDIGKPFLGGDIVPLTIKSLAFPS
ncbi:MAG: ethanolamine ammonia-lyase reactivating factor EutA [Candidatus Accumulibacter sp.]|jgi:ethanolamine utilization protein EutA|nr:ethanolamine ammonia-lyase reactivating factor EutA [Accumulibacter sp.]